MFKHLLLTATTAGVLFTVPAVAGRPADQRGYQGWRTASGRFCLRPTTTEAADRFGIPLYRYGCATREHWARVGLTVEVRRVPVA